MGWSAALVSIGIGTVPLVSRGQVTCVVEAIDGGPTGRFVAPRIGKQALSQLNQFDGIKRH